MDMPLSGERLLTIGEFSRLSQLSIRMLRYYDEHDVLRPTQVDRRSGYRSYSPGLLRVAGWVRELRDVGLGVDEIATCVVLLDDAAAMRAVLERQRSRLVAEATGALDRIREVDHLIYALEGPVMSIEINRRTIPAYTAASLRDVIPTFADEPILWNRLMPAMAAAGATPPPAPKVIAVFHDDDYHETDVDVEVRLEVTEPFAGSDDAQCVEVPEQEVAVGTLVGPYDGVGVVMEAVGRWVPENGYRFAGPMFDVYLVSPHQDPEPSHWVTEVCIPITPVASGARS
jgi:DNA-binding transcriptional MerR regulator